MIPQKQTEVLERVDPKLSHGGGSGDHDRFSHIVRKADQARGYVLGQEIEAICGKRWVPSRDPKRYPLCPTCKEIYEGAGFTVPEE